MRFLYVKLLFLQTRQICLCYALPLPVLLPPLVSLPQCMGQSAPAVSDRHLSPGVYRMGRAKGAKRHKEKGAQQHAFRGLLFGNCAGKSRSEMRARYCWQSRALGDTWDLNTERERNNRFP